MYYDWVDDFFSKICLYDFSQIGLDISIELGFTHYVCVVSYFAIFVQSVVGSVISTHQASVQYSFLPGFYIVCQFILVLADVSMWCINLRMKNEQHLLGNKNEYEIQCLGWNQECCTNVSVFVPMLVWQKSYCAGHE